MSPYKKLRSGGGYRRSASFQTATLVYDATYWFCEKFVDARSRTVDQMIQAARSGRQNITEGSRAATASSQTELRLMNVARASLEELLLDYEDYLRHRRLSCWTLNSREATSVRRIASVSNLTLLSDQERYALYASWLDHPSPAIRANAIICLIHQANFLLDRQILALEEAFITHGGYSEQLATERLRQRAQRRKDGQDIKPPSCPKCKALTTLRTAKTGKAPGSQFWGCTRYPDCNGVVPV